MKEIVIFIGFAGMLIPSAPATAEVFCVAKSYQINGYVPGMPALENIKLADGSTMANLSLGATNCSDPATSQRLAIALTAQARGLSLQLYSGTVNSWQRLRQRRWPIARICMSSGFT
jgi:hypothetical protein